MRELTLERQRPWRLEIELIEASGRSRADAVNLVIIEWLKMGDTAPLIDAIGTGDVVDPVLSYIALMLKPDKQRLPYYLALRRRPGRGAPKKPGTLVRDIAAALEYERRYKDVGRHDQAVLETAKKFGKFGIDEASVRRAVTRLRKKMQAIDRSTIKKS